jgi:hypothetical protein
MSEASVNVASEPLSPAGQFCRTDDQEEYKDDDPDLAGRQAEHRDDGYYPAMRLEASLQLKPET